MSAKRRFLNVGGNNKSIPIPAYLEGYEHLLLDIDPTGNPDIVCDARALTTLEPAQFDAVYCSHNLEHYYRHDVPKVLAGFRHVLKPDGFVQIIVPDLEAVMQDVVKRGLDLEDTLYQTPGGPIMVLDVIYGYGLQIETSGEEFFAHKTGFTKKSLVKAMLAAGFERVYGAANNLEVSALALVGPPSAEVRAIFGLPEG